MDTLYTIRKSVCACAVYGAISWTVYAVVECWFSIILPWIINPSSSYKPLHWGFTVLLFILYPIIGLVSGVLVGLILGIGAKHIPLLQHMKFSESFPKVSAITVIFAFNVSLFVNYSASSTRLLGLSELPPLSISLVIAFGLLISTGSNNLFRRLRFITNPWTMSILLLGLPWIYNELFSRQSRIVNAVVAVLYILSILLVSLFVQKKIKNRQTVKSNAIVLISFGKVPIFLAMVALVMQAVIFYLVQAPPREDSNLNTSFPDINYPSIILVTMDTVRADHLSLYGYERNTTPNLKELSKEATLYTRSIASSDQTLSTHASIFTGLYSREHGAHFDPWNGYLAGRPLAQKFHTLAEILFEKGYRTIGIIANPNFFPHFYQLDQGFQHYDTTDHIPFLAPTRPYFIRQLICNILIQFMPREAFDMLYLRADKINRKVFNILENVKDNDRPFFLFINYMDAHQPYFPPSPFDMLYPGKDDTFTTARYFPMAWEVIKLERNVSEKEKIHLISQYDGAIANIDFHLGKLIKRLKTLGMYENSLIIITSDHGEAFGERNLINHGVSVYQDQVHIPLIIKYPNSRQEHIVDEIVSVVDIKPTVLDILGCEIPENLQGQSLLKLEKRSSRSIISETFPSGHLLQLHQRFNRVEYAIFSGPLKYISSTAGKKELYNLLKDPNEEENIYQAGEAESLELETRLHQWLKATRVQTDLADRTKPDKEIFNRLKALGYIK